MPRPVHIVGQAPRSFPIADDHEVWAINGPRVPERWDVLFQLHGPDHIDQVDDNERIRALMDDAARVGGLRLITTAAVAEDFPGAEVYPLEELMGDLLARRYLTGSFAMAVALAVHERRPAIVLDGVQFHGTLDHWSAGEAWAVPCLEYHIGRAEALDIEVTVPPGCGLFAHSDFVYGLEGPGSV